MTNNGDDVKSKVNKFEELEKLNALIDVWIDDEDYLNVDKALNINTTEINISDNGEGKKASLESLFESLFRKGVENTHELDKEWRVALGYKENILPVTQVKDKGSIIKKFNDNDELDQDWSHLFYAKLLRAKIKQKGNDCYTRRLDDVAAYLERHLPKRTKGEDSEREEWETRLTLMYLLELSAVSLDWESLGFAERARRVITDEKYSLKKTDEKAPYEFYELWARFNIGVAYFHKTRYRKAVQEFNRIIWQVERWGGNKQNWIFFKDNHGVALLYLPAILYRADVQLKLQFAYHSLDTLGKRFWRKKGKKHLALDGEVGKCRISQKEVRAKIIEAEAYQQLGRPDDSWDIFNKVCPLLRFRQLGKRTKCYVPHRLKQRFPGFEERFIDLLTADHLGWLKLEGEDERINQKDDLELRYISKNGRTEKGKIATAKDYEEAVNDSILFYLNKLVEIFKNYFSVVEHHAYNRSGYFQQLAKYLGWLVKAADYKYSDPNFACGQQEKQEVDAAREKIAKVAINLYEANREGLRFNEDKLDKPKIGCRYCDARGIDLRKLGADHYTWFTEDMLKFFNSKKIMEVGLQQKGNIEEDKKEFVSRLIKREQIDREDLRIRDLELRYEYYGNEELLEKLYETERRESLAGLSEIDKERLLTELCEKEKGKRRLVKYAEYYLCRGGLGNQVELSNLPICGNNEYQEDSHLKSGDYINIMQGWDEYFLHHLQSPSIHENQKGGFYFMGLQRWNSASPAKGYSVGGGYLLYHLNEKNKEVDMGIAIDPGFDFVRNLFHMGFSLDDIDIVLISHAHLDHIRDFESIIMLLSELKKRRKREKRVHVILSLGAYRRLEHIVEDPGFRYFLEPYIIDVDREISNDYFEDKEKMPKFRFKPVNGNRKHDNSNYMERFKAVLPSESAPTSGLWAKITPTRAYHDDKTSYSDSFGFLIELNENKPGNLTFGYTGDTKWVYPNMPNPLEKDSSKDKRKIEDIAEQYKECDVLLVHLGSLVGKDINNEFSFAQYDQCSRNDNEYRCEKLVRENDHPYLIGMLRLLSSYYNCVSSVNHTSKHLVLVSEFGEELRGTIRTDFIRRLQEIYKNKLAFLPVDVGLNVQMGKKDGAQGDSRNDRCACKVWCVQCDHFVNIGDADFELYGTDHALYCVCKTCRKTTPINVLQDKLRQLYEVGLELRNNDNK